MRAPHEGRSPASRAFRTWLRFRLDAVRSFRWRVCLLLRGAYVGEGTRIPGGGRLDFEPGVQVQRLGVLNARAGATIRIGQRSRIGAFSVISATQSIVIGDDVLIADRVFISDHNHESADPDRPVIAQGVGGVAPVVIEDGCWLGISVCILPGVHLGRNCIVGSLSVVTRSFPAGSIVGGIPAKLIRQRTGDDR